MENTLTTKITDLLKQRKIMSECDFYVEPALMEWKFDQRAVYETLEKLFQEDKILKLKCQTPKKIENPSLDSLYEQAFYMVKK